MEFEIYKENLPDNITVEVGDFCNLLPSFMEVYDPDDYPEFTKEQFIDLINREIDMRVKEKAVIKDIASPFINLYSYFRIEWYEDGKMYDLYLPDKHLKIKRYIFEGDTVIIDPVKVKWILQYYTLSDDEDKKKELEEIYYNWAKNRTSFKVSSMYVGESEVYKKFSKWWCVLDNKEIKDNPIVEYVSLPDWCLIKPLNAYNKKPLIKKFHNY